VTKSSDVEVFNKLAETLSFTRTAQVLGISRSSVSKRITRLEQQLGVNLFHRSSRNVALTGAGDRYYRHTAQLANILLEASKAARSMHEEPAGPLSVTMPTCLGALLLPSLTRTAQANWPNVKLDVNLDDRIVDIVGDGYDVAIRVSPALDDSALVARQLVRTPEVVLASPAYLERFGQPQSPHALRSAHCLTLGRRRSSWQFRQRGELIHVNLERTIAVNNRLAMILAACLGRGIIRAPRLLVESEMRRQRLTTLLQGIDCTRDFGVFAVFPRRNPTAAARAFVDFIERWLPHLGDIDRWNPLNQRGRDDPS